MESYVNHIINKYKISKKCYNKKLDIDDMTSYLYYFDIMNSYSIFPTIISFNIEKYIDNVKDINNIIIDYGSYNNLDTSKFTKKIEKKTKAYLQLFDRAEINKNIKIYEKYVTNSTEKYISLRRFFYYELTDELTNNYNAENTTIAWLKCYELLYYHKLLDNFDTIKCFCICEQPGAFIYAINHYAQEQLNKKIDFIIQSLNSKLFKDAFPPSEHLYKLYKNKYDYGPNLTGDITDLDNIKYYRKKYYDDNISLITVDCGVNCSDDFSQQENNSIILILGQLITAIGLSNKRSNYFFKLFTIYENITHHIIFLLGLLYENVCISRVLSTKITSGEIYCVCLNFRYDKNDVTILFDKLCIWYDNYKVDKNNSANLLCDIIPDKYYKYLNHINKFFLYRRLLNYNFMYFRYLNYTVTFKNKNIGEYVYGISKHYVEYFISLYKIKKLKNDHKLVPHIFTKKKTQNRHHVELTSNIYKMDIDYLSPIYYNDEYMQLLEGHDMFYKYKHKEDTIILSYTQNTEHLKTHNDGTTIINLYKEQLKIIYRKPRSDVIKIGNTYIALYDNYKNVLLMSNIIKFVSKYKKIKNIYLYDFTSIRKYKKTKSFDSKFMIKYMKIKHDILYKYNDCNDFSLKIGNVNDTTLYVILYTLRKHYTYKNINVFNIFISSIIKLIIKLNIGSTFVFIIPPNNILLFCDIINYISQYFEHVYLYKCKYTTMLSVSVICINKNKHIDVDNENIKMILNLSLNNNTISRLYTNVNYNCVEFLDNVLNIYSKLYYLFIDTIDLKFKDKIYCKFIFNTITHKKNMIDKLMNDYIDM
jgi:hypothetical protein